MAEGWPAAATRTTNPTHALDPKAVFRTVAGDDISRISDLELRPLHTEVLPILAG